MKEQNSQRKEVLGGSAFKMNGIEPLSAFASLSSDIPHDPIEKRNIPTSTLTHNPNQRLSSYTPHAQDRDASHDTGVPHLPVFDAPHDRVSPRSPSFEASHEKRVAHPPIYDASLDEISSHEPNQNGPERHLSNLDASHNQVFQAPNILALRTPQQSPHPYPFVTGFQHFNTPSKHKISLDQNYLDVPAKWILHPPSTNVNSLNHFPTTHERIYSICFYSNKKFSMDSFERNTK